MIQTVYTTDSSKIKYLDCNPASYKKVVFQSCNLDIRDGSNVLVQVPLCDFKLESIGSSEMGGCGGTLKRRVTIQANGNFILTAPEVGQEQGEVQFIIIKVAYTKNAPEEEKYLLWEYKGNVYPVGPLMVLSGRTQPGIPYQGWDLGYYSNNPPDPSFSPTIFPSVTSPDLTFGGILFTNPGGSPVELEIFVFN